MPVLISDADVEAMANATEAVFGHWQTPIGHATTPTTDSSGDVSYRVTVEIPSISNGWPIGAGVRGSAVVYSGPEFLAADFPEKWTIAGNGAEATVAIPSDLPPTWVDAGVSQVPGRHIWITVGQGAQQ
jgi:hypothetical protein